jgi:hypothetical protein
LVLLSGLHGFFARTLALMQPAIVGNNAGTAILQLPSKSNEWGWPLLLLIGVL